MKRVVLGLAMVLSSFVSATSPQKPAATEIRYGSCDGELGEFDVYLVRHPVKKDHFVLRIVPVVLTTQNVPVSIVAANRHLDWKELVKLTKAQEEKTIMAGLISEEEIKRLDQLLIAVRTNTEISAMRNANGSNFCTWPKKTIKDLEKEPHVFERGRDKREAPAAKTTH